MGNPTFRMVQTIPLASNGSEADGLIASGVHGLRIVMVNLYAIEGDDGRWVLVDTGLYFSEKRIREWSSQLFGGRKPEAIVLTHGHFDHIGAVRTLAEEWDVPVYAHPMEVPYLTGKSKYPPPEPAVGRGMMAWMSPIYPRGPIDLGARLRTLPEDGSIPGLPGWRWIHTPGHTAGHVSLFRDGDRVLIAGDAFVTTRQESVFSVVTQRAELNGPPAYYTSDWEAAKLSVQRLAGLQPLVLATGHGLPMTGIEATAALDALAENFDSWARSWKGRYANQPAMTDERGLVSVPPAVRNPMPLLVASAAVAGLATWILVKRNRRQRALDYGEPVGRF
ncbi:MAG TPA: MBL fold metallo-hydrolase [Bryobacteraceae bacterium]|nr:MBL fold metallo-hydrolase [Bryobacteraceae bacterium]